MPDNPRIEELRRRVHKDPASIAFAQLAEEYRRSGNYDEAVRVCRAGLAKHPSYLSARVTLGRALLELAQYDEAQTELGYVLRSAPENLAAIRGLAEIHQRRGELDEALKHYQTALGIAKHDPELEESVHELTRQLGPGHPAVAPFARTEVRASQPEGHESPMVIPPPIPIAVPEARGDLSSSAGNEAAALETSGPMISPELEAAADEFTRALQALDAITLDLPTTSLDMKTFEVPAVTPTEDERLVPAQDWKTEGFDAAWTTRKEAPAETSVEDPFAGIVGPSVPAAPVATGTMAGAGTLQPSDPDANALQELESWLDNIVAHRAEPSKKA